jgi:hypothetical protein
MKFLRDILTADAQSKTYDIVRTGVAGSLFVGNCLVVYDVLARGAPFDYSDFGLGVAAILGAGGAAMWARKDTED